jgi:radical SAM-linked protein
MRFASHRDVARAVERGVRMAGLPVAYSAGFSPHPKISYPGGAPTGAASEAEYLELSLTGHRVPAEVHKRLDAALPDGIDVIEVVELDEQTGAPKLEASLWQVVLPGVGAAAAAEAVRAFLAAPSAEVDRLTSKGIRRLDARAAVLSIEPDQRAGADHRAGCAILRMVVRQMTPVVRPDDILTALRRMSALEPSSPPLVTRLAQGPLGPEATAVTGPPVSMRAAGTLGSSGPAGPAAEPPRASRQGAEQGPQKAARLDAENAAVAAGTAPASAYEQLPRGADDPSRGQCAREPDGRDCPDARNRAAEQTGRR